MKRLWLGMFVLLALLQQAAAQAPVAAFSSNRQSGCAPLGVNFKDESSNTPKYWSWDFGNGQFSNQQNPSVTYAQPGTYNVTLTVRNGDGTHAVTKNAYITVSESPQASFTASNTLTCAPASIRFTDNSVPNNSPITEWYWDFGDGTTSTEQHPVKSYTEPGFYTVSLRVTSATGCVASRSVGRMIRVTPGVTAEFNFTPPPTCRPPFVVNFSNQTSGPGTLTYQWDFGNSTGSTETDPAGTYAATGSFNVTLTARSQYGCSDVITKPVAISTPVTDFSGPSGACLNTPVTFTDASSTTPVSSFWTLGNGTSSDQSSATATYTAPGTYNVKIVNTYDVCKDSITKPIVVSDKPFVNFSAPARGGCQAPFTVNFTANAPTAVSWEWNFGDGNTSTAQHPSHTYTSEGNFNVTLTITNADGCTNTVTQNNFVSIKAPQIRFANAPAGGCIPFSFSPRASVAAPDGVRSYAWDFGNGQTGTGASPVTNYTTEGKFALTLTVVTNGGCTQTYTLPDAVETGTRRTAAFTTNETDVCATSEIRFTNLSDADTDEWLWDFGDGNTSTDRNPVHRFRDTGNFTVQLIAYYQKCASTPVTTVIHNKPPLAGLRYVADCSVDNHYNFVNTSKVDHSLPVSYLWNFGDGATSTAENPAHTFTGPGPYTISLQVTNGSCTNEIRTNLILADETPDFTISPQPACTNSPVRLETINSDPAKINFYHWSIDGGPFVQGNRNHQISIPDPGNHSIRLRITDIHNCQRISPAKTLVTNGPRARFTPATRGDCRNNDISFTDQSSSALPISKWIFDFGDGNTREFTAPPFTYRYADTGSFTVKLTVVDADGCQGIYTDPLPIRITGPVIGFRSDYTTVCPRTNIQFTDTTTGNILSYRWDFGDGTSSTLQNPVHAFEGTDGNTFKIKLEVTDAAGCTDSAVRNDYVILKTPKPAMDIADTTTICPPLQTSFFNRSQDYESFYWDFGDGGASSLDEPTHFYNNFGEYTATLYVLGIGGCIESVSRTVRVIDPAINTDFNFNPAAACDTLIVDFTINPPEYTSFTFNFGDGTTDNTQSKSLQHMYTVPNNYRPSILLRDSMGCQVTISHRNTVQILGAEVLFGIDRKRFCDEGQIFFTDYTRPRFDPILSREWDFGDGVTSTEDHPAHHYTEPGTYYPRLTAVTGAGCSSVMIDTVRVYRTPVPSIDGNATACINTEHPLRAVLQVPDTAITWKWEPGGNGETAVLKYNTSGTYTVNLQATNLLGCGGNTSKEILVPPLPDITVQQDPVIPVGGSITLPVTYTGDIVSWNWVPANALNCDDCPNPVASPKFTTKYVVQVTDSYGCTNSKGITVNVQCNDKNYFVPNTFSPNNDGHNDRFYPRGKNVTRINSMKVFNRWGELLFERRNFAANDPAAGWDGTAKGKPANPDVYIYVIEFICENAAIVPFRGNVMLLK